MRSYSRVMNERIFGTCFPFGVRSTSEAVSCRRRISTFTETCFAQEKGKYEIIGGALKTADDMVEVYRDIISRYPAVVMIVNPLRMEDREQWPKLCEMISEK